MCCKSLLFLHLFWWQCYHFDFRKRMRFTCSFENDGEKSCKNWLENEFCILPRYFTQSRQRKWPFLQYFGIFLYLTYFFVTLLAEFIPCPSGVWANVDGEEISTLWLRHHHHHHHHHHHGQQNPHHHHSLLSPSCKCYLTPAAPAAAAREAVLLQAENT